MRQSPAGGAGPGGLCHPPPCPRVAPLPEPRGGSPGREEPRFWLAPPRTCWGSQRQRGPSWGLSKGPAVPVEPQAIFSSCCHETKNNRKNKQEDGSSNIGYFGPGMSSRGGRGHTRLLRARESPCAQQTSGPEVPTQPGPPSPVPLRGLGAGDLAASHQLHAVWPRAPHPPLGASAPSSVTPRPAVGARGRPAPGPAEAPSTLAREECAPTAEARLPCTPDVAGGRHPQRTRRDRRGQGGSEGHTPPCQRGRSARPRLPRGVSASCCWAQSRGPGS